MTDTNSPDFNNLNSFLDSAMKTISCGTDCQKQKTSSQLKQKYDETKSNLVLAQPKFIEAKKNYIVYTEGDSVYKELQEKELNQKANIISGKLKEQFDKLIYQNKTAIQTYNALFSNYNNVNELYVSYKKENNKLFVKFKENKSNILTNDRKTFYENQKIEELNGYYYYVLLIIYYIIIFCISIFYFIYKPNFNIKNFITIIVLLIIFPFFSTYILTTFFFIFNIIYNYIPKNSYI